jgi:hypothetical protein
VNRQSYRQRLADMLMRHGKTADPRDHAASPSGGHHYDPSQPRVPAGHSDGGRWTRGGATGRITPQSAPHRTVQHDPTGQETWQTVATDRRPDGSIAEQLIVNRDGSRIRSQYAPLGANAGWEERHTVMTPDGQVVTFENSGLTQTVYDGQGRKVSQVAMTEDGPEPQAFVQPAFHPGYWAAQQGITAALALLAWLSGRNGPDGAAVLMFRAGEYKRGATKDDPAIWVGRLSQEKVDEACPRRKDVQDYADTAVRTIHKGNYPTAAEYGTAVHKKVEGMIKAHPDPNFRAEVSVIKSDEESYGEPGTKRIDAFEKPQTSTVCIHDLKTGNSKLTWSRMLELASHVHHMYDGIQRIIVTQVKPNR